MKNNETAHHAAALPAFILYGWHIKAPNETKVKRGGFSFPYSFTIIHWFTDDYKDFKYIARFTIARPESPYGCTDISFQPFPNS